MSECTACGQKIVGTMVVMESADPWLANLSCDTTDCVEVIGYKVIGKIAVTP